MDRKDERRMFWWLEEWQLAEQEAWLTSMSTAGWHLVRTNIGRATFRRGKPEDFRYRCDVFKAGDWSEQDRLSLYQEAGWEHVANRGLVQIFRSPASAAIPEIHTDPVEHVRNIRKLLPGHLASSLLAFLVTVGLALLYRFRTAEAILSTDLLTVIIILFMLGWVLLSFGALLQVLRYMKRVRGQLASTQPVDWRRQMRRRQLSGVLLILVFALVWGDRITGLVSKTPDFPPIPDSDLPVVRLSQVLDSEQYAKASPYTGFYKDKGDVFNYYRQEGSLPVPEQHYLAEAMLVTKATEPAGATIMLHVDAYRAISPRVANRLAANLAQKRPRAISRSSLPLPPANETHGFDGLWLLETQSQYDLIAWQGNWVYYLSYSGTGSLERIIQVLRSVL